MEPTTRMRESAAIMQVVLRCKWMLCVGATISIAHASDVAAHASVNISAALAATPPNTAQYRRLGGPN